MKNETHNALRASMEVSNTDPVLVRLFDTVLLPLESDEEHAISHEQFKRLDEIRDDLLDAKRRINARLVELGHAPLYISNF